MKLSSTTDLTHAQLLQLQELWNNEYPEQLAYGDLAEFRSYLGGLAHITHFLMRNEQNLIMAWAFSFTRHGERWFAIILNGSIQRQGLGSRMLNHLKEKEEILYGWVTDHNRYVKKDKTNYPSPLGFYLKNGFTVCDGVRLETDKLSAVKIQWKT